MKELCDLLLRVPVDTLLAVNSDRQVEVATKGSAKALLRLVIVRTRRNKAIEAVFILQMRRPYQTDQAPTQGMEQEKTLQEL